VGVVVAALGLVRLRANDDVRGLYASSPELVRQQATVERLMQLPSAGQFFLLTAGDAQTLLEQDEALSADLEALHADGTLSGFQSVSRFVPSEKTQRADQALEWRRLFGPNGIAPVLFEKLGSPQAAAIARAQASRPQAPLTPHDWLASPLSLPFRPLWLGQTPSGFASLVTVSGVSGEAALSRLGAVASRHPGVQFVDHLRDISGLLGHFRGQISWLLAAGYAVVSLLLFLRYRKEAWRALVPALLACVGTAGLLGWLGVDFNLFCVFGLLLSLDMGVDYGVYMQERGAGDFRVSVLSASLAAVTTLLSFGLLALSHTPALRDFGLTVLFAIGGSWLLAPCFQERVEP
jgi:predicted exporter